MFIFCLFKLISAKSELLKSLQINSIILNYHHPTLKPVRAASWCVITLMTQKINTSSGDVISNVSDLLLLCPNGTVLFSAWYNIFFVQH